MRKVKWQNWTYLISLIDDFESFNEIVILKARQLGISWLVCAYALWKCIFHGNAKVLMFSQGESEAWELVAKCRYIWQNLPVFLKPSIQHDTRGWIDFPVMGSEIKAYPSTEKAGRSTDATLVIRDELEFHPYARENFSAVGPTIDAGGQIIDLSTINKEVGDSHFQDRVIKAVNGESNAHFVFLGWKLRPTRSEGLSLEEWFDLRIRPKYTEFQIEQEYPESLEQALAPTRTRGFFSNDALNDMEPDCMEPIPMPDINTFNGMVKVFKLPVIGRRYCGFTDPSDGMDDPHFSIFIDSQTGEEVAESHGKVTADICAKIHDTLVRYYNDAYNSYELNAHAGGKFDESVKNLETPGRAPFISPDGKPNLDNEGRIKKYGWWTSPQLKRKMLYGLEEAVRNRMIRVHSKDTINEFRNFIIPEGENPQAKRGWHDDRVMGWAGVWHLSKFAPIQGEIKSYRPHTRR